VMWAWIVLGESIVLIQATGMAVVLGALAVLTLSAARA